MASSTFVSRGIAGFIFDGSVLTTKATRFCLGGNTTSFPSLIRAGTTMAMGLAGGGSTGGIRTNISALELAGVMTLSSATPTISSGFGTNPSIVAGKAYAFTLNVGTGGTASSGVIGLPTATTGWIVNVQNITAQAANRASVRTCQTASTTTTATIQNQNVATGAATAWAASDILHITAIAY